MAQMNTVNGISPLEIPKNTKGIFNTRSVTVTQSTTGMLLGHPIYNTGSGYGTGNNTVAASSNIVGLVSKILGSTSFEFVESGNLTMSGLTPGAPYYLGVNEIVTPMPTSGLIVFMGVAVSTTQLILNIVPQSDVVSASLLPVGSIVYSIRTTANPPKNCLPLNGATINGFSYGQLWKFVNEKGLIGTDVGSFKIVSATKKTLQLPNVNNVHILPNQALDILRPNKKILGGFLGSVSPTHHHKSVQGTGYTHNSGSGAMLFSTSGTIKTTPNSGAVSKAPAGAECEVNAVYYIPYIVYR